MSRRLMERINEVIMREGSPGKTRLALAVERHEATLDRWMKQGVPSADKAYQLALACGCTDGEALEIAKECVPSEKESA